jgi:hypothetical protein
LEVVKKKLSRNLRTGEEGGRMGKTRENRMKRLTADAWEKIRKEFLVCPKEASEYGHITAEIFRTGSNIALGLSVSALVGLFFLPVDSTAEIPLVDSGLLYILIALYPFFGLILNFCARNAEIRFSNWQQNKIVKTKLDSDRNCGLEKYR